uniref:Metallo-beta-lactamase superfamily hydrolase n=1 Tax=Tetraselmis sp. GSL018 TaxID=582737 RepID=A0A061QNV1_9CHLO
MLLKMKCLNFEAFPGTQHACTSSRQHLRVSASVQPESSQRVELREKRKQNVPGPFWVDSSCINCDTCRWIEPSVFHADGGQSAVHHQPSEGSEEEAAALRAVTACPTGSIHFSNEEMTRVQASAKVREGAVSFPYLFPKARELGLEIYHLGYHSRDSFAATPWLVRNAETDLAVMVDTPRYSSKLKRAILDRVGEVKYIFLTHSHDVADHNKWAQELGAKRVIHECEADPSLAMTKEAGLGLDECEIKLQGEGPWDPFEGALGDQAAVAAGPHAGRRGDALPTRGPRTGGGLHGRPPGVCPSARAPRHLPVHQLPAARGSGRGAPAVGGRHGRG